MRKNVFGRHLKRDKNERKALFKGLMSAFILYGKLKTTESKAKAIKGQLDKLINKARKDKGKAELDLFLSSKAIQKLKEEILPQLNSRTSGYARSVRMGNRFSDNAEVMLMQWTDYKEIQNSKLKIKNVEDKDKVSEKVEKPKRVTRKIKSTVEK